MPQSDPYAAALQKLMTLARTLTIYFPQVWQVTDNYADFNRGGDNFLILLLPGAFSSTRVSDLRDDTTWSALADLVVKFGQNDIASAKFQAVRWTLLELLRSYPTLDGTVKAIQMTAPQDAQFAKGVNSSTANMVVQTLKFSFVQHLIYEDKE